MFEPGFLVGSFLSLFSRVFEAGKGSFACRALKEAFLNSRDRALHSAGLIILGAGASFLLLELIERKTISLSYLPFLMLLALAGLAFLRGGAGLDEAYRRSFLRRSWRKVRGDKDYSPGIQSLNERSPSSAGG